MYRVNPRAKRIYVVVDNARYYWSKKVREYLENSRVVLLNLPPYAPNLNLIERLWRFFKKKVLANKYYETHVEFHEACLSFFDPHSLLRFGSELNSLLNSRFQIISA